MTVYHRITRECSFNQLQSELIQAIQDYSQQHHPMNIEPDILMCCETISEQKTKGGLAAWLEGNVDTLYYTGMLVTPQWLIWARHGDKSGITVSAAKLKEIQVNIFTSKLLKDRGLEVYGYINDSKKRVGGYIGLGSEEAAQKFGEVVLQAVEETRPKTPPAKRRFFGMRWF